MIRWFLPILLAALAASSFAATAEARKRPRASIARPYVMKVWTEPGAPAALAQAAYEARTRWGRDPRPACRRHSLVVVVRELEDVWGRGGDYWSTDGNLCTLWIDPEVLQAPAWVLQNVVDHEYGHAALGCGHTADDPVSVMYSPPDGVQIAWGEGPYREDASHTCPTP